MNIDMEKFLIERILPEWNVIKDYVICDLVSTVDNDGYLYNKTTDWRGDLKILYQILIGNDIGKRTTIPITHKLYGNYEIRKSELAATAIRNLERLNPPKLIDISDEFKDKTELLYNDEPMLSEVYSLTNWNGINGTSSVLNNKVMKKINEKMSNGFYLLPASIHEWVIVAKKQGITVGQLKEAVKYVREKHEVSPEEFLSDGIFKYDHRDGRFLDIT